MMQARRHASFCSTLWLDVDICEMRETQHALGRSRSRDGKKKRGKTHRNGSGSTGGEEFATGD
jgi:hypothetical protein